MSYSLLCESFGKTERAQYQHPYPDEEQRGQLRPQYLEPNTLQKNTPQDNKEISERIGVGDKLKNPGHILDRRDKSGEENGGLKKEKRCH